MGPPRPRRNAAAVAGTTINTSSTDRRAIKQVQFGYCDGTSRVLTGNVISD